MAPREEPTQEGLVCPAITYTRVVKRIVRAVWNSARYGGIVVCIGPAGVGKTTAGRFLEETIGAIYSRTPLGEGYEAQRDRWCGELMENAPSFDPDRLLIVDEADRATDGGLEYLSHLNTKTAAPILLLRREPWGRPDEEDGWRAICNVAEEVLIEDQPLFNRAEVRAIFESPTVKLHPTAVRYLHQTANAPGGGAIRRCQNLLAIAAKCAHLRLGAADEDQVEVRDTDLAAIA